jgi:hypothetical protein
MYKNIFFMLLLIQSSYNTFAQGFLRVGYGWGYANPREINRLIDVHNTLNQEYYNTGNDLNKIHSFGGLMFGFGKEDENLGFEITWQNKHSVSSSNFMYNNEEIERRLKIRSNCLSFALYGGSENVKFGASLDMGTFKGLYKRAPKSAIKDTSYIHLFQTFQQLGGPTFLKDGDFIRTLQIGMTPFVQLEKGPIGVRLFYQFQFMRLSIDDLDYVLMGGQKIQNNHNLKDKMNNFGILLYLKLGGYYD